ncbi:MAG: hypothetical protein WBX25_35555 [Rhodomicrobium sp.]
MNPAVVILPSNGYEVKLRPDGTAEPVHVYEDFDEENPNEKLRLENPAEYKRIFGERRELAPPPSERRDVTPMAEAPFKPKTLEEMSADDLRALSDAELLELAAKHRVEP